MLAPASAMLPGACSTWIATLDVVRAPAAPHMLFAALKAGEGALAGDGVHFRVAQMNLRMALGSGPKRVCAGDAVVVGG